MCQVMVFIFFFVETGIFFFFLFESYDLFLLRKSIQDNCYFALYKFMLAPTINTSIKLTLNLKVVIKTKPFGIYISLNYLFI